MATDCPLGSTETISQGQTSVMRPQTLKCYLFIMQENNTSPLKPINRKIVIFLLSQPQFSSLHNPLSIKKRFSSAIFLVKSFHPCYR